MLLNVACCTDISELLILGYIVLSAFNAPS